jgi:putative ABC transport system permease protein
MTTFLQELRYAARSFRKSPGFAFVAVATLALGIGANAAIFALVDRVLLTLLPVRNPKELVLLRSPGPAQGHAWSDGDSASSFSYPLYRDLRDSNTVFTGLLAEYPFDASVSARGGTERASGELVSGNYFEVLGVPPALGRNLTARDDRAPGAHPQTVLSHGYWTRHFGNDPSILDKTIVVNGLPLTVVGVARAGFSGIQPGRPADLFVPTMMKAQMTPFWNGLDDPKDRWLQIVGRLKPGLSPAQAQTALQPTYRPLLQAQLPLMTNWNDNTRRQFLDKKMLLVAGGHGRAVLREGYGKPLISLMGMVLVVLLIACSNLAGLLAARGAARQREYGIRLAMGASRMQLLRQSIVECLLFAFAGGALGLLVAAWTLHTLLAAFPPDADLRQLAAQIDPRVLGFAALVSLTAGIIFGVSPALRAARLDPARTLRGQGRGTVSAAHDVLRFRRGLVTAQVALTLVLLVGAGLFVSSLQNLGHVELGLKPDRILGFSIAPKLNAYTAPRTANLARRLTEALSTLPGVRSVSAAELSTLTDDTSGTNVAIEGAESAPSDNRVLYNRIGPEYFATLGIPLVAGREIAWTDDAGAPKVAVINEAMARRFLPGRNPLGARLAFGRGLDARPDTAIVGIVRNSKSAQVSEKEGPFLYLPYLQDAKLGELTFYVRAANDPTLLASAIRERVRRLDPQLPIRDVKSLRAQISDSLVTQRLIMLLSAAFGGLAALLAALGIYGVLAFSVAQRRQEIGVRIALGAEPSAVRGLIFSEVTRFLLVGAAIGLPAAYALGRAVESILYGVHASDLWVFAVGVALMAAVSLAAAYPSARRAARTNPMEALRSE